MDESMKELATKVQRARKARHWTQDELASRAGVKVGMLSNFERFRTTPQASNLRNILQALELESEAGDAQASETRSEWPAEVQVFLDVMGVYLTALDDAPRLRAIHDITRQIVGVRP